MKRCTLILTYSSACARQADGLVTQTNCIQRFKTGSAILQYASARAANSTSACHGYQSYFTCREGWRRDGAQRRHFRYSRAAKNATAQVSEAIAEREPLKATPYEMRPPKSELPKITHYVPYSGVKHDLAGWLSEDFEAVSNLEEDIAVDVHVDSAQAGLSYILENEDGLARPEIWKSQDVDSHELDTLLFEPVMAAALKEYEESIGGVKGGEESWLDGVVANADIVDGWANKEDRLSHLAALEKPIGHDEFQTDGVRMKNLVSRLLSQGHRTQDIAYEWRIGERRRSVRPLMLFLIENKHSRLAFRLFEAALTPVAYGPELHPKACLKPTRRSDVFLTEVIFEHFLARTYKAYTNMENPTAKRKAATFRNLFQSWSSKLIDLVTLLNKENFPIHITDKQYQFLTRVVTPAQNRHLHREIDTLNQDLPEGVLLSFISPLARQGNFTEAFNILQRIQRSVAKGSNNEPRLWAFRELMFRLYKAGVPIHTSDLLEVFLLHRDSVDNRIYHAFLFAAVKANDVDTALALYRDFEHVTKSKPSIITYTCMFNLFKRVGDHSGMHDIYSQALQAGTKPHKDVAFVNSILHAECFGQWNTYSKVYSKYREFFHEDPLVVCGLPHGPTPAMIPHPSDLLVPDHVTLAIMIFAYYGQTEHVAYRGNVIWYHYQRYVACISGPNRLPAFVVANEHIIGTFILALGKDVSGLPRAVSITKQMTSADFPFLPSPTLITFNSLLRCFARHADFEGAEQVLATILKRNLKPNTFTYNTMMMANSRAGRDEEAGVWLARMLKEGWTGDDYTRLVIEKAQDQKALVDGFKNEKERLEGYQSQTIVNRV